MPISEWLQEAPPDAAADTPLTRWYTGAGEAERLNLSVEKGSEADPERKARVLRLQARTGLPADLIDRNLERVEQEAARADFDAERYRRESPVVSQWLAEHPDHAAVAQEDLTRLGYLERQLRHIGSQKRRGDLTLELRDIGQAAILGSVTPEQRARQAEIERELRLEPDYGITGFFEGIPGAVANQLPIFGATLLGKVKGAVAGGAVGATGGAAAGATSALIAGQLGPQVATPEEAVTVPAGALSGAATGASRGVVLGWRYGGAVEAARMEASLAYLEFEQMQLEDGQHMPRDAALAAAVVVGVVNGSLEALGFESVAKNVPGLRALSRGGMKQLLRVPTVRRALTRYASRTGQAMLTEGMTELIQSLVKNGVGEFTRLAESGQLGRMSGTEILGRIFSDEHLEEALAEGRVGAQAGGGMSAALGTGSVAIDIRRARQAQRNQALIEAVGQAVADTKLRERLPEAMQDVVSRITRDGEVSSLYIPVDTWDTYWQTQGVDPREVAQEVMGDTTAYDHAAETHTDIEIPTGVYAARLAGTDHNAALSRELRTAPMEMNAAEAETYFQRLDEQEPQQATEQTALDSAAQVRQDIVQQLEAAGFEARTAETYGQLYESAFRSLGERSGQDPLALYQRYQLQVGRALSDIVQQADQSGRLDMLIEQVRAGQVEEGTPAAMLRDTLARAGVDLSADNETVKQAIQQRLAERPDGQVFLAQATEDQAPAEQTQAAETVLAQDSGDLAGNRLTPPTELEQRSGDKKGFIRIGSDRRISITLLQEADLSTFIHETGHFYLEVLGDLATADDAPASLRTDYQSVLDWLGVPNRVEITTKHHEQWARGFEAYLREGQAPSAALRQAFARFRAWLVSIYRTLRGLNVELTDEVRGVMDRLVATEDEIQAARAQQSMGPLFENASESGMSPEAFDDYRRAVEEARREAEDLVAGQVMAEVQRERKRWWREARRAVRAEVAAEIHQRLPYIVLSILQRGKLPDGSDLPAGMQPVKLSRQSLVDAYGEEVLRRLPRPYVYAREGGIHPDQAAEMFGYQSGQGLIEALTAVPRMNQAIEAETDDRMRARYGDMILDGTIAVEAMKAAHNDRQAEIMMLEAVQLAKKTNRRVPPLSFLREQVRRIIAERKVREINPLLYQRAEARAARAAFDAAKRQDFAAAQLEQQRRILNHELYREAVRAREQADKIAEYMGKFAKRSVRERLAQAGADYLDQIDALRERFDFARGVSLRSIDRRKALAAWVQQQQELGISVSVPEKLLNEAYRTHYREMTLEELQGVYDSVRMIEHLARLKNKLIAGARAREMQEAVDDIVSSIEAHHQTEIEPPDFAPSLRKRMAEKARGVAAAHTKMEFLFQHLDGYEALGPVWRHLFRPIAKAEDNENTMMRDVVSNLSRIFSTYSRSERAQWFFRRTSIPQVGPMTKANMLSVALNWGNQYNREALMEGYGWSEAQVQAILGQLDKRDWDTVQAIWDYIDTFWPAIERQEKAIAGIAPPKVEAIAVETPHGTYRGGYYPIVFDNKLSWRQSVLEEKADVREMFGGHWARAMTRHGHTEARTSTGGKPIRLELSGLTNHLTNVVHDLAFRRAVIDVGRLVNRSDVRRAIEAAAGREMYRQINPWLVAIAAERRDSANPLEGILGRARAGATVVNMGWKMTTALVQFMGYTVSTKELGARYAAIGLREAYAHPMSIREAYEFAASRSAMMRDRRTSYDRDVRDALKKLNVAGTQPGVVGFVDAYTTGLRDTWFSMIAWMDMGVALPTWLGAYRKAMDGAVKGIEAGNEQVAIDYADSIVRQTQGAGGVKDLATVQRGNEAFKLFTMFYSYFSVLYNQFAKTYKEFRVNGGIGRFVASMMLLWFVPAVLEDLLLGRGPEDDADDEEWIKWALKKEATYPFQSVILLRDVINGMDQYGYEPSAAFDAFEQLARAGRLATLTATGDKEDLTRADVKGLVQTTGYAFHLPTRQLWTTGEYFYDWMTGNTEPSNPIEAAWRALVTGTPREDKP